MLRLFECVPALTPNAALALPWWYAMGLINTRRDEVERVQEPADGTSEHRLPPADPVMSSAGFQHAPGYSQLLRMFRQ